MFEKEAEEHLLILNQMRSILGVSNDYIKLATSLCNEITSKTVEKNILSEVKPKETEKNDSKWMCWCDP